ncbi:PASTA domain-containing protein [Leucobacter sp. M11]|uniref:PASTA domain-containing protein n=1 Tax=Leucobacter sp. M11 TaxID=2993565 RepID=UPI002D803631|nr:PASTA domain-containing protein [Leucobacter sp. M11]MEB4615993.1 PASTA domain-containing protein [Leucobacter sp. M11]
MTENPSVPPKNQKPWYMKWWVWLLAALVLIGGISNLMDPPPKVAVPEVSGLPAVEAVAKLEEAGLRVSIAEAGKYSAGGKHFDAVDTDPAGGESVRSGSKVTLNVTKATARLAAEEEEAKRAAAEEEATREAERAIAEEEARAKAAQSAVQPLSEDNARPFCLEYADQSFPYGIKVHYVMGVLAEEKTDSGWYMKYKATITNEYGAKRDSNIECHMSGTNGSPAMDDFLAY